MATEKMKKVGLLYAPENANFADKIVAALAASGFDAVLLEGGAGARMVAPTTPLVVIWSSASIVSDDILNAARQSLAAKRIIPISLGKTPPPKGFEHVWPMDLVGWNHDANDPRWQFVVDELEIAYRHAELEVEDEPDVTLGNDVNSANAHDADDLEPASAVEPDNHLYADEELEVSLFEQPTSDDTLIGDLRTSAVSISDDALRAPRKSVPTRKRKAASSQSGSPRNAARFLTPNVLAGGVSIGLLGVISLAIISFLPRSSPTNADVIDAKPIVAFVEPTEFPQTGTTEFRAAATGSPREVLPQQDGFMNEPNLQLAAGEELDLAAPIAPDTTGENINSTSSVAADVSELTTERLDVPQDINDLIEPDESAFAATTESADTDNMAVAATVLPPRLKASVIADGSTTESPSAQIDSSPEAAPSSDEVLAVLIAETINDEAPPTAAQEASFSAVASVEEIAIETTSADDAIAELTWNATKAEGVPKVAVSYFKECVDCPDMVSLPTGAYMMGSPAGEASRREFEGPRREIKISRAFSISTQEITFDEWDACVRGGGCRGYGPFDAGWGRGRRPVVNVSYNDARAYCAWLSEKTGSTYRLPSEAEWEYAARGGTATPFSFGASLSPRLANYHGEFPYAGAEGLYRRQTVRVASFAPNPFGLYDMHGNVREWTADCWTENHLNAPEDGAPRDGDCTRRAVKGGAWNSGGWRLRSAHRYALEDGERTIDTGFRVVRDAD